MDKLFSTDGKLFRGMEKAVNIVYLNLLWILFSIPIVTIGASTTALFSVMMKLARDKEGYIVKSYWKAFKENFKTATILWMIIIAVGTFFVADIYFFFNIEWSAGRYIGMIFIGIMLIFVLAVLYMFPLQAQFEFEKGIIHIIKNALFLVSRHFAWSILLLFVYLIMIFLMWLFWYVAGWCIVGIGAFVCACIYNRIFKKYIPEEKHDEY